MTIIITIKAIVVGAFGTIPKGQIKVENWRVSGDHSNYSIVKIVQNTEKSPGNLRRLAVTQTPVKEHLLTLVWKTRQERNQTVCKKWKITGKSNTRRANVQSGHRMEFSIEKCALLLMKSGKRNRTDGMELANQRVLWHLFILILLRLSRTCRTMVKINPGIPEIMFIHAGCVQHLCKSTHFEECGSLFLGVDSQYAMFVWETTTPFYHSHLAALYYFVWSTIITNP